MSDEARPTDSSAAELRKRAEMKARLEAAQPADLLALSPEETLRILHDLRVHQIELEMQNEELRRAQIELDASRARYFDLYELAPVGYCTVSEKGLVLEANLTAATLLNVSRDALVKQPIFRFILPEDQDSFYRHRKQLFETSQPQKFELRMLGGKGEPFWVQLDATAAQDESGAPVSRVVLVDVSERKRAEEDRRKLQLQLIQAQKMESVGRLAGGVAHDFNNMLLVIIGNAEWAGERVPPDDPLHDAIRPILNAARRCAAVTRQLLGYARRQMIRPEEIDLNKTIEAMLPMLRRFVGGRIDMSWVPAASIWPVRVDPLQIDQILGSLCSNARDAIDGVGRITIETGAVTFDETYCADHEEFVPGDYVLLAVSDDGCGMDRQTLDNIFEPFFTTKDVGKGTGLGLATTYGIVQQNDGFISVSSEPGEGTTFKIYLPRCKKEDPISPDVPGSETILLVEDEPAALRLLARMLTHLGFNVLTASTPDEAIQQAEAYSGKIHLLLADAKGRDSVQQVLASYPDMKLLVIPGYAAEIPDREMGDAATHFIQRPFSIIDLAVKVRQTLDT